MMADNMNIPVEEERGSLSCCRKCVEMKSGQVSVNYLEQLIVCSEDSNSAFSEQGSSTPSETDSEGLLDPMEQGRKLQQHRYNNSVAYGENPLNYNGRRRHSATGIEHVPDDVTPQEGSAANTEAIHKFLSLCLKQFQSFSSEEGENSRESGESRKHHRRHGNKESSKYRASASSHQSMADKNITLVPATTGSPDGQQRVCRYCSREMKPGVRGLQHHLELCPRYPVKCPNMCGRMDIPREQLTNHIIDDCPKATESCTYKHVGCSFQGSKNNLADHLEGSHDDHLQLACQLIQDQKTELDRQKERMRKQEEAIYQLTETTAKIKHLFEEQIKQKDNQDKAIQKLTEQVKDQKKHQNKIEKELKNKLGDLEKKDTVSPPDNSLLRYPGLNGYGEQIWKITNFRKRLARVRTGRSDDPICSEPFYTSAFGYKISCWAYLNGRGKEVGHSMSVYACVMYGEYDAVLRWPIKPRYTFTLLDQVPDVEDRKDIVRVRKVHDIKRDDVRRKGIDRPNRDERAIIVGFDDLVSHDDLENGTYVFEDCLFIRIVVDVPEN